MSPYLPDQPPLGEWTFRIMCPHGQSMRIDTAAICGPHMPKEAPEPSLTWRERFRIWKEVRRLNKDLMQ